MQVSLTLLKITCNMQNMQNNMHDMQNMQTSFPICRICSAHFADERDGSDRAVERGRPPTGGPVRSDRERTDAVTFFPSHSARRASFHYGENDLGHCGDPGNDSIIEDLNCTVTTQFPSQLIFQCFKRRQHFVNPGAPSLNDSFDRWEPLNAFKPEDSEEMPRTVPGLLGNLI
jgi:hypothetical protein